MKIKVLGIPCEVSFRIQPADRSVGIMQPYFEDIEFRNAKNGSAMKWLENKVEKLDKWEEVYETINQAITKHEQEF